MTVIEHERIIQWLITLNLSAMKHVIVSQPITSQYPMYKRYSPTRLRPIDLTAFTLVF